MGTRWGLSPRLRGNPARLTASCWSMPVYPRACGGTYGALSIPDCGGTALPNGSIPAPAGEPFPECVLPRRREVYPRACGGTAHSRGAVRVHFGLSPRLRGNLASSSFRRRVSTVYPRACGGTGGALCPVLGAWRSIPAPAGEPTSSGRPRGPSPGSIPAPAGEPGPIGRQHFRMGSIPAPAGEPPSRWRAKTNCKKGLSPRLRGNLPMVSTCAQPLGSIPAPAGEPIGHS